MFEQGGGGSYAAPTGPAPPRLSNFAKMKAVMKRKEETGKGLERGLYTAEELTAAEAASGWTLAEFADVPLRVGWLLEKRQQAGATKPVLLFDEQCGQCRGLMAV